MRKIQKPSRIVTKTFFSILLTASSFSLEASMVGLWRFDEGTAGCPASQLTTEANSPLLDGTANSTGTGQKPSFDLDIHTHCVWSDLCADATSYPNYLSLRFINKGLPDNPNSGEGSCVTVTNNSILLISNITVEAFVKIDRHVNWPLIVGKQRSDGNGTSWSLDMNNAGQPRVRIDSQPLGTSSGNGWNQCWTAPQVIEDGEWHHLAFSYTHTNRSIKLYVDRTLQAYGVSFSNLVYDSRELRIGQGAGDRAFDGWIDTIRITDTPLTPEQMLSITAPSTTVGYWAFEDGSSNSAAATLTNDFNVPFLDGIASGYTGGNSPVFSDKTPPNATHRISAGENGPIHTVHNGASLRFTNADLPASSSSKVGGIVTIRGDTQLTQVSNFTAEAFVLVDRHVNYPQIFGKTRKETGGLTWSLGLDAAGKLRARFDTQTTSTTTGFNQIFSSSQSLEDEKWHHIALTYDGCTRAVTLYVDYILVSQGTTLLPLAIDTGDLCIGNGDRAFDGWIDEVRLTSEVLEPTEFLRTTPIVGSVTVVQ